VGWAVFTIDAAMQQRIKHLSARGFMVDQTVQRSKHPNINLFQHWLPRIPRPQQIECVRLKGKEHVNPWTRRQPLWYGKIQYMEAGEFYNHLANLVDNLQGPVFFVGHAFENEHAAFAAMGLPRCAELLQKIPGIDTQKLFAFANDCSMNRSAASLGKIIMELCGVHPEIKIDTFFRPHNGGNDAVMTYLLLLLKLSKLYNKLEVN